MKLKYTLLPLLLISTAAHAGSIYTTKDGDDCHPVHTSTDADVAYQPEYPEEYGTTHPELRIDLRPQLDAVTKNRALQERAGMSELHVGSFRMDKEGGQTIEILGDTADTHTQECHTE